jgi:hypothetical protein
MVTWSDDAKGGNVCLWLILWPITDSYIIIVATATKQSELSHAYALYMRLDFTGRMNMKLKDSAADIWYSIAATYRIRLACRACWWKKSAWIPQFAKDEICLPSILMISICFIEISFEVGNFEVFGEIDRGVSAILDMSCCFAKVHTTKYKRSETANSRWYGLYRNQLWTGHEEL